MLKLSLLYPLNDDGRVKKLGLILVSYLALVTSPVLVGYYLRTLRHCALENDATLPPTKPYGEMWSTGLGAWIATVLVVAIPGWVILIATTAIQAFVLPRDATGQMIYSILMLLGFLPILWLVPAILGLWAFNDKGSFLSLYRRAWKISKLSPSNYAVAVFAPLLLAIASAWTVETVPYPIVAFLIFIPACVYLWSVHAHYLGCYFKKYALPAGLVTIAKKPES